jgi:hypothetical protein
VIRLGLRLTVSGGREAVARLMLIVVAVAIGVGLLLSVLAGLNGVSNQNARYAWLETGYGGGQAQADSAVTYPPPGDQPVWWWVRGDYYQGQQIGRVDVAATGPHSPVPPGITALPGPGQFYASPAMTKLLRTTPAGDLADRYPGTRIGTIGDAALPSPNALIIVIGRTVADLSHQRGARLEPRISTVTPGRCSGDCAPGVGTNSNGLILILSVVAAAMLFPVLMFVGAATRLSAARREQRFAAMRLVGATTRQVSVISAVESVAATLLGAVLGLGLFFVIRPLVAMIPFTGERFFTSDLSLSWLDYAVVLVGIPTASVIAARLALRRVTISPLGVSRRTTPRPPRAWRLLPLIAGLAELSYFAYVKDIGARTHTNTTEEAGVFLAGVLLVMAGLVLAGPWLTMHVSRLIARRANRPSALIAARRLSDDPHTAFRAVSGVVLALFVGTCAVGIITTISAGSTSAAISGPAAKATLVDSLFDPAQVAPRALPAGTIQRLDSVPGVTGTAIIRDQPKSMAGVALREQPIQEVVPCTELATVPVLGRCEPDASLAAFNPYYYGGVLGHGESMSDITWPTARSSSRPLGSLPIDTVVVGTDGSVRAVEQARTVLDAALPTARSQTVSELSADQQRLLDDYRRLADVVILISLPIAGCSLAVSIAAGLAERRRPFSLLRLAGAPLTTLRRVIGFETTAPLLATAAVSVGVGFLVASLFLRAQLAQSLTSPGVSYWLTAVAGILASVVVIASALPMLDRMTGPDVARND